MINDSISLYENQVMRDKIAERKSIGQIRLMEAVNKTRERERERNAC